MITIDIAKDYTTTPGGRFIKEGPYSGEDFRINVLYPKYLEAKKAGIKLKIILDGCLGYPSSFIDESFGELARQLKNNRILDEMEIISNDQPWLIDYIKSRVDTANE